MSVIRLALLTGLAAATLAGCNRETRLEGERLDIRARWGGDEVATANRSLPISLASQSANPAWSHRQGLNGARPGHPALSAAPAHIWATPIGQGDARRLNLNTQPVAAGGVIYTLDALARVQATSTSGQALWSVDLTPPQQRDPNASGGGLAVADGRLYVTSAYAFLAALDASTGREIWRVDFAAPISGAPSVQGNRVFVVANDGTLWGIDTQTGRVDWSIADASDVASVVAAPTPAVAGNRVIFPTNAGTLTAVRAGNGGIDWRSVVAGRRTGAAYSNISSMTGEPVVDGGRVYAANHQGRLSALDLATGQTLWSAASAAMSPVWPVGGSVFLVTDQNQLQRLDASSGQPIWSVPLPFHREVRRMRNWGTIHAQFGPVLAGGRIWVADSTGPLRGFDPASGALVQEITVPSGAASGPIVAGQTLYILARDGVLHAYR